MKKFKGSFYGFLIGDAMGVPVEFCQREELLLDPVTRMIGYRNYDIPAGSWSDDSSMMLATMDSITSKNKIDYDDIMKKFSEWISYAKYTSVDYVFDIGRTTLKAIVRYQNGMEALECGLKGDNFNGNGSLMRMVPIAFYAYAKNLEENDIIDLVSLSSSLTHSHGISILGCYIYVRYLIFLLDGFDKNQSYDLIKKLDYSFVSSEIKEEYKNLFADNFLSLPLDKISSTGYIVHTLESVIWCVNNTNSFKEAIIGAINLGGDTDTIGALTGALAGIIYGFHSIPKYWINNLQKKDYLKLMYSSFLKTLNRI